MIGANLFVENFFDPEPSLEFNKNKFDIIIGNPPWERSSEDDLILNYCKSKGKTIGDKQWEN